MNDKLLTKKFMDGGDVMESQSAISGPGDKQRRSNRRRKRACRKGKRKGCGAKVRYRV